MTLALALTALKSRKVRSAVTSFGVRRFAANTITNVDDPKNDLDSVVTKTVTNGYSKFFGFIVTNLKNQYSGVGQIDWKGIWGKIVTTVRFLNNFNWNATDKELDAQIQQGMVALASRAGATAGNALGYFFCGAVPGAVLLAVNEPMGAYVLSELSEEAADEIASNIGALLNLVAQQTVKYAFITIYKNYRNIIRPAALGVAQLLKKFGYLDQESIDKANKSKNEPWTFAEAHEESVDRIKDPLKKAFVEELWEELGDACIEAGYVVANSVDTFYAQQKISNEMFFGKERTVEITLNRDAEATVQTT